MSNVSTYCLERELSLITFNHLTFVLHSCRFKYHLRHNQIVGHNAPPVQISISARSSSWFGKSQHEEIPSSSTVPRQSPHNPLSDSSVRRNASIINTNSFHFSLELVPFGWKHPLISQSTSSFVPSKFPSGNAIYHMQELFRRNSARLPGVFLLFDWFTKEGCLDASAKQLYLCDLS